MCEIQINWNISQAVYRPLHIGHPHYGRLLLSLTENSKKSVNWFKWNMVLSFVFQLILQRAHFYLSGIKILVAYQETVKYVDIPGVDQQNHVSLKFSG